MINDELLFIKLKECFCDIKNVLLYLLFVIFVEFFIRLEINFYCGLWLYVDLLIVSY